MYSLPLRSTYDVIRSPSIRSFSLCGKHRVSILESLASFHQGFVSILQLHVSILQLLDFIYGRRRLLLFTQRRINSRMHLAIFYGRNIVGYSFGIHSAVVVVRRSSQRGKDGSRFSARRLVAVFLVGAGVGCRFLGFPIVQAAGQFRSGIRFDMLDPFRSLVCLFVVVEESQALLLDSLDQCVNNFLSSVAGFFRCHELSSNFVHQISHFDVGLVFAITRVLDFGGAGITAEHHLVAFLLVWDLLRKVFHGRRDGLLGSFRRFYLSLGRHGYTINRKDGNTEVSG
mmetsp:Transcript_33781/g.50097  ORF Transcript_33781/g.50097 Transcript_33781/m.50097 type:complete len:285 (-) Transcript_33781:107-961(-)